MGSLTGLSTSAYATPPLSLPAPHAPTVSAFAWTIVLAVAVAIVVFLIVQIGRRAMDVVSRRPFVVIPVAALVVAGLAIAFGQITGKPVDLVLFSGQDGMGQLVKEAATLSVSTLVLLILFKGLAYGISLGSGRGGPTFPAMFLGIVGGLLASHVGFAETPAVAALMGAATVSVLGLPLSSVILAMVVSQAGLSTAPLIIVAVAVAFITVRVLEARQDSRTQTPAPDLGGDGKVEHASISEPRRPAAVS
jgi:MFS family permease